MAIIDDDEVAGVLLAELAALGKQQAALAEEQEALRAERASWEVTQARLRELVDWRRVVARKVDLLNYEGRRLALEALGVEVRVWSTRHTPRYEIKMIPDAAPVLISDPQMASGVALAGARVRGCIHRGYARPAAHRADRP